MAVWLTYSVSDFLLFTPHTYYRLFELYNRAIWPMHLLAAALGVALIIQLLRGGAGRGHLVAAILALCWLWVAWAYLYERYDTINWAAHYAALGFAAEAALLIVFGIALNRFTLGTDGISRIGLALIAFALLIHPLFAPFFGRPWMQIEFFGLAPDPTVTATLGALIAVTRVPWPLFIIPLLWCAVTGATLWAMNAPDALLMPAVGVLVASLTALKTRTKSEAP